MLLSLAAIILTASNPALNDFRVWTNSLSDQPEWKVRAANNALLRIANGEDVVRTGKFTAYCSGCDHTGITRSGKRLSRGYAAADKRHWKIGHATIWVGTPSKKLNKRFGPWNVSKDLEDTGGAIKGRHRFDICFGFVDKCRCNEFGVRKIRYIKLNGER